MIPYSGPDFASTPSPFPSSPPTLGAHLVDEMKMKKKMVRMKRMFDFGGEACRC
jgi:hypothetical protein